MDISNAARAAKKAYIRNSQTEGSIRAAALYRIAERLASDKEAIFRANREDISRSESEGIAGPLLKRLRFDGAKLADVTDGLRCLAEMEDPVGRIIFTRELDDGLVLRKVSCPIGVIGVIFESRPDALVQISSLCLKSGNSVMLKGGSEARETNKALASAVYGASLEAGIGEGWMQLLESRQEVNELLRMDDCIDLLIPRGSNEFVRYIMDNTRIPVLGHADGICHCYVDKDADIDMALDVAEDSKLQYPAVCNALETLLVHAGIAGKFLPAIKKRLDVKNVTIYGCEKTRKLIDALPASEDTYRTEHLDYALSVKVVESVEEAVDHINRYGSGHTDAIITEDPAKAEMFMDLTDSANVFHNCSTRFSDGYRYGFGAEVGISTNKIHARGPVGIDGLLIYKYKLAGSGQTVADYVNGVKKFRHSR